MPSMRFNHHCQKVGVSAAVAERELPIRARFQQRKGRRPSSAELIRPLQCIEGKHRLWQRSYSSVSVEQMFNQRVEHLKCNLIAKGDCVAVSAIKIPCKKILTIFS
ncbi:hypothetical protein PIB30_050563 [Stylosanthes scabra]|uniref:Uncharacterized protein n=1 Tax=Stylosanthes scabra TaxID=79078 RepID=A0ABU6RI10_9FABA|nr:hypothetical protein [Stylosanthes scabra]